jgi:tetratricopeptide (TPR) repeat protein
VIEQQEHPRAASGLLMTTTELRQPCDDAAPSLGGAIAAYQAALDDLSQETPDSQPKVIRVLIARDAVAQVASIAPPLAPEEFCRFSELDAQLKANAARIDRLVGRSTLAGWRETRQPPAGTWWWSLDERAAAAESKPSPFWAILAGLFLALSLSLTAEIARRFLSGGADFFSVFSTVSQGLLALLAGSTFTQAGRQAVEGALSRLGIERSIQDGWKMGLALAVLLVVLGLRFSLPIIARLYNNHAARLQQNGSVTSAIENYQRAISLDADYAEAHYNLGTAYEDVLEYDKAISEYQTALIADRRFSHVTNNLARLYILRRASPSSYSSALQLVNDELNRSPKERNLEYSLYKNRGWAYLGLNLHELAERDLRHALTLRADGAAAHCLLAQVLEAQEKPTEALAAWELCLAYDRHDFVDAIWLGTAETRLIRGGRQ